MDLKIEIRNLFALHEATLRLEHGVREVLPPDDWRPFSPSRFIYAFFTFNGVYSYDWQKSFERKKAVRWEPNGNRYPSEKDQFKAYLKVTSDRLGLDAPRLFAEEFRSVLTPSIPKPGDELRQLSLVNASKELTRLADQFPRYVELLHQNKVKPGDFHDTAYHVLKFVYKVRCNLFHGAKTRVQLQDTAQQRRLEVYTGLVVATNSLLFHVAAIADIGWRDVNVSFHS